MKKVVLIPGSNCEVHQIYTIFCFKKGQKVTSYARSKSEEPFLWLYCHLYPFPVDEELLLQSGPEIEKKRDGNVCALRVEKLLRKQAAHYELDQYPHP